MRGRLCRLAGMCVSFLLAAVFFVAGSQYGRRADDFCQNVTFLAQGGTGSSEAGYTAWKEYKQESVRESIGGRTAVLDITAVSGPSRNVLPVGLNITEGDEKGCIIGYEAAEKLFGTRLAEGRKLTWGNRTWTVRGVVEKPSGLLMVQMGQDAGEITFDRVSASLAGGVDRRLAVQRFVRESGISGQQLRWDYLYGIGWLRELVPGRWSDFEGWKQNLTQYKTSRRILKQTEKSTVEAEGLTMKGREIAFFCLGCLFFAVGFFLWLRPLLPIKKV